MESVVASNSEALRIETPAEDESVYSYSASVSTASSVLRKIDFRPARKQFNGLNGSSKNGEFWIETLNPDPGRKRPLQQQQQQQGMESGKKKVESGSDFVENGLDPELAFRINFRRIGAGLENLGNTCFLNSVLQCLTYTEPLAAYLQNSKHQNSCHIAGFCALCAIQKHVSRALQSSGRSLVPKDLVSNLRCISRNFRNARQEDAHEYMVNLLESMHKCCLPLGTPSESPAAYEKSLVHKIFGGRLRSRVQCQQCHRPSDKFDPFLDLSLDIVKASSLPVALQNFTAPEMLDGGEKQYQCQRCRQKVRAKKQLTVHKAPYVLTIHLKRFHAHDPGRKIDKNVVFGPSLDMKPFISDNSYEGKLEYSLYGVLVHFGHNTHSGHYVCFVRTSSGMWYLLNDNEVRQASEKTVLAQKAYMLFYVRDRKVTASKRPCDTSISKENVKAAVSSNIANSVFKQLSKEHADNALVENRVGSSSMKQKDELSIGTSKDGSSLGKSMGTLLKKMPTEENDVGPKGSLPMADPILEPSSTVTLLDDHSKASCSPNDVKTIPIQQNDVVPKGLAPKADPALEPSVTAPLLDDHSKTSSSPNSNPVESLPPLVPSVIVNSNMDAPKCENATIPIGILTSSCNGLHNSAMDKPGMNETSQQINLVSNTRGLSNVSSGVTDEEKLDIVQQVTVPVDSGKKLDEIDPANSPDKLRSETNQGTSMPNESAAAYSLSNKDVAGSQGIGQELNKSSISSPMPVHRKSKKKLLKRQALMLITPRSHFFRTLVLMGKKKHKKSKCRTRDAYDLVKEQLLNHINKLSSELGPSTSEKSMTTLDLRKSQKKGAKSSSRKGETAGKCNNNPAMDMRFGELRERSNQNGAMPATELLENSSTSITEANRQNARQPDSTQNIKEDPLRNGKLNMLCQRTVPRWDGGVSQIDSNIETETTSIGHVGDEWDEEYDRGKRKKLRDASFKNKFGGPNLFQEIATNKTRSEPRSTKSKKHRARFGNQPFRI